MSISWEEVAKNNTESSCYMVIAGTVYDVTKFLNEHPGGSEVMLEYAGRDATTAFEDIGHSTDARKMLIKYAKGPVSGSPPSVPKKAAPAKAASSSNGGGIGAPAIVVAVVAILAAIYFLTL